MAPIPACQRTAVKHPNRQDLAREWAAAAVAAALANSEATLRRKLAEAESYQTPSPFAARFGQRFELSPTAMRYMRREELFETLYLA